MKNLTKNAILQAFQELLEEVPFDKITVSMLVKRCGIHHNTFYYHYQDIYQLLDSWIYQELGRFSQKDINRPWEENVKALLVSCKKNRKIVNHIQHSLSREHLERFVFSATDDAFTRYVAKEAEGKDVSIETVQDVAKFCRVFQYLQTFKTLLTSVVQIAAVYPGADALRYLFCNPFLSPVGISPAFAENPP